MKFVLATRNRGKMLEIRALLPQFEILSLDDIAFHDEIEETGSTLEENAELKARTVYKYAGIPALADDSGLEVEALKGLPGVRSARYAGPEANDFKNIEKLIHELGSTSNRKAAFRTMLAFINEEGVTFFEGKCAGQIVLEPKGSGGFGYDPVFQPDGFDTTFAEMDSALKNSISHRGKALSNFVAYLG